jgi:hypothetical protein
VGIGTGRTSFNDARDPALGVHQIQRPVDCGSIVIIATPADEDSHTPILLKYSCKSLFFVVAYSGFWWVIRVLKILPTPMIS